MIKKNETRLKRFYWFSVVINVKGAQKVGWKKLDSREIYNQLVEYEFPTPKILRQLLMQKRYISCNSANEKNIRYFEIDELKGQLERGSENGRPHYNLILRTTSQVRCSDLARELSLLFFKSKNDKSIQVEPAHNPDALGFYCSKEISRLELIDTEYYPPFVDSEDFKFEKSMKDDPDMLKVSKESFLYQEQILDIIESSAESRKIRLVFEPKGGIGKSKLAKFIDLSPKVRAILAPSLSDSSDRWCCAFHQQIDNFQKAFGSYPKGVVFDLTKAEDFSKITAMYSILENLKNGKIESTLYGRFKRLWMTNPHVIVLMNTVPSTNLLSEDRFDYNYISQKKHGALLLACRVDLNIVRMNRGFVIWQYSATVEPAEVQFESSKEILNPETMEKFSKALAEVDSSIYTESFKGARRTAPEMKAPEYVQEAICMLPMEKELQALKQKEFNEKIMKHISD